MEKSTSEALADLGKDFRQRSASTQRPPAVTDSPLSLAMHICGVNDVDNKRAFSSVMWRKGFQESFDEVYRFKAELAHGEHRKLDSRGRCRVLMSRLTELPTKHS